MNFLSLVLGNSIHCLKIRGIIFQQIFQSGDVQRIAYSVRQFYTNSLDAGEIMHGWIGGQVFSRRSYDFAILLTIPYLSHNVEHLVKGFLFAIDENNRNIHAIYSVISTLDLLPCTELESSRSLVLGSVFGNLVEKIHKLLLQITLHNKIAVFVLDCLIGYFIEQTVVIDAFNKVEYVLIFKNNLILVALETIIAIFQGFDYRIVFHLLIIELCGIASSLFPVVNSYFLYVPFEFISRQWKNLQQCFL